MTKRESPVKLCDKMNEVVDFVEDVLFNEINNQCNVVLASVLILVYKYGLKKSDLDGVLKLRVKNVCSKEGAIIDEIIIQFRTKNDDLTLSNLKNFLTYHLSNLKDHGYKVSRNSFLFPLDKKGNRYTSRTIGDQLKKVNFNKTPIKKIGLDKIRQAGIRHYYNTLYQNIFPCEADKIMATTEFARCSKRQTISILEGKIQKAGIRKSRTIKNNIASKDPKKSKLVLNYRSLIKKVKKNDDGELPDSNNLDDQYSDEQQLDNDIYDIDKVDFDDDDEIDDVDF